MTTARGNPDGQDEGHGSARSTRPIHVPTLRRRMEELGLSAEQLSSGSLGGGSYVAPRTLYRALKGEPLARATRIAIARLVGISLEELENGPEALPVAADSPAAAKPKVETLGPEGLLPSGSAGRSSARSRWAAWGGLLAALIATAVGVAPRFFHPRPRPLAGVVVQPGTFVMGASLEQDPQRQDDEGPLTEVTISHPLWVKSTEVTQREWDELFSANPSTFRTCGADCPVTEVSWWDAVAWANKRSEMDGYEACYALQGCVGTPGVPGPECDRATFRGVQCDGYRLPTEAEWEYFARAGTTTPLYTGELGLRGKNWADGLDPIAWYGGNSKVAYANAADCSNWREMQVPASRCGLHPVAQKKPNAWGVYDVLGNVAEWMTDTYLSHLPGGSVTDPVELVGEGSDGEHFRSLRGGAWAWDARDVRISNRHKERGSTRLRNYGFRPVRTIRDDPKAHSEKEMSK